MFCCCKNSWTKPTQDSSNTNVNCLNRFGFSCQRLKAFTHVFNLKEGFSVQSVSRVRRAQRELEAAEERADVAESSLNMVRAKHRTFVTTSTVPGGQVYMVQETVTRRSSVERN